MDLPGVKLAQEIGRGGFGTVYAKKDDPSTCVKVSNKAKLSCREWSNEFKKVSTFMSVIENNREFKKLKIVRVVKPTEFHETPNICYMEMPRIYRPGGQKDTGPTIQAQLGVTSSRLTHKGRGEFIGLREIREYMSQEDIEQAARELGTMMALIHFIGRNDAYDVELYLGKEAGDKKPRFYLADFDLSEVVPTRVDEQTMRRITWSMDAVPYFPRPTTDAHLFRLFLQGYSTIVNDEETVANIFATYD